MALQVSFLGVSASMGFILALVLFTTSCSVPNLEQPECDQARDTLREFYSLHFGNALGFSKGELEMRRRYLTPRFFDELQSSPPVVDPFTGTGDPPKTFRAGQCRVLEPNRRVSFELLLFWKTDTRSEQRAIAVESENRDGKWLIDKITN